MADAFINSVEAGTDLTVTDSFFDSTLNEGTSTLATGKPTADMQIQDTFATAGWSLNLIWFLNGGYPILEGNPPSTPCLLLRYRNDGKPNWSNYREVSLGKLGDTEIFKRISGLGSYRNRQYEIVCTAGVPLTITGLEENVNLGGTRGG